MRRVTILVCRIVIVVCAEIIDVLEPEPFGPVVKWSKQETDYRMEP